VKLEKKVTDIYIILLSVCGEQSVSRTQVSVWVKWFQDGREIVTDDKESPLQHLRGLIHMSP